MRFASRQLRQGLAPQHAVWLVAALAGSATCLAEAADLYVVCNANVALQVSEVRDVFVGEKSFAGNAHLAPADNLAAQAAFLERVVKVSADRYASLWTKKSFRDGANPPPVKASDAETLAYVRQTPGACSYVQTAPPAGINTIGKF